MIEHPILFSAPMVRAILAGMKTQTRRIVKPQPTWDGKWFRWDGHKPNSPYGACSGNTLNASFMMQGSCPFGAVGDILWVREAWRVESIHDGTPPRDLPHTRHIQYEAGVHEVMWPAAMGKLRPSIHMPRWASRITLEVSEVRVERLQDISEADAEAEGVTGWGHYDHIGELNMEASDAYRLLWESIHGQGSWAASPFVWCVSIKRL